MPPPTIPGYATNNLLKTTASSLAVPRNSTDTGDLVNYTDTVATYAEGFSFAAGTATGLDIGTTSSQKIGFYGATPIVRPSSTTDLRVSLINLGLYTTGGASPLDLNGGAFTAAAGTFSGVLTVTSGAIAVNDGTPAHGAISIAVNPFGAGISFYGNSTDANAKASLTSVDTSLNFGPGGAAVFDWKLVRTGTAAATLTGDIATGSTTGSTFATATSQKLGFYAATPIVQPSSTTDLRVALINLGLYATGGASPLNLNGGALTVGTSALTDTVTITDAKNVVVGSTTGTIFATATSQKLGFYNATPIVQPSSTTDIRVALINLGLYATGGASPLNLNGGALTAAAGAFSGNVTNTNGSTVITDGTAAHGSVSIAVNAFGPFVNMDAATTDTTRSVSLSAVGGGAVSLGIGGSTATDIKLQRTAANTATYTGNFAFGTSTGTIFATATSQKFSFWNKTPIVQPTTGITGATRVGGGGTTITTTDTFGGYTVAQALAILINTGLTA